MPNMSDLGFKFSIGQEVTLKAMRTSFGMPVVEGKPETVRPQKMVVVGRIHEECEGGIQRHYKVRIYEVVNRGWDLNSFSSGVYKEVFLFGELELEPWAV